MTGQVANLAAKRIANERTAADERVKSAFCDMLDEIKGAIERGVLPPSLLIACAPSLWPLVRAMRGKCDD